MPEIEWEEKHVTRFWSQVRKTENCWEWTGGLFKGNGYGQFRVGKRKVKAHRFSYIIKYGEFFSELRVCHTCDNRICVRPDHLFLGTDSDNAIDRETKGRRRISKGSACSWSLLSEKDVREIHDLYACRRFLQREIATIYGVALSTIFSAFRNWKHVN